MSYLFGPINSRRLGLSLGIDLVPYKTCSYDCIYCECGRTTVLTDKIKEYVDTDSVIRELEDFIKSGKKTDFFTFSGSGEPTLAYNIKYVIDYLSSKGIKNIVVLTNGSLFYRDEVINNVKESSIIIPSLDAATDETFEKINKPYGGIKLKDVINGLISLRKHYTGFIALEIFVIEGLNTSCDELMLFKEYIGRIMPDQIQLNTLDRPGVDKGIKKASYNTLEEIKSFLGHKNTIIVARSSENNISTNYDISNLVESIKRRPLTIDDIKFMTGLLPKQIYQILENIKVNYTLVEEEVNGKLFFKIIS